jgi:hypothetical protein
MTIIMPKKILWKDTDISSIQQFIKKKQGAADNEIRKKNCRTRIIRTYLKSLVDKEKITCNFRLVDLFCGDAIIITYLKKYFKTAEIIGVDINRFDTHEEAKKSGVEIKYKYVQKYIKTRREKIDVLLMLNTYRNYSLSGMTKREFDKINKWMLKTCRHAIITAKNIKRIKKYGFKPLIIGKGEGNSMMIDLKGVE